MKKNLLLLSLALTTLFFVSACGAGDKSPGIAMEKAAAATEAAMEYGRDAYPAGEVYGESAADSYEGEPAAGIQSGSLEVTAVPSDRKLIRTVSLQVETDAFDVLLSGINAKLTELGGYVETSDVSGTSLSYYGDPMPKHASLTVRIPDDKLSVFIITVENSGNVTNKSETTEDVTLKYSDVESRKKSLEIEQERIWTFLEKAETIDTVIMLEQRLSDIRYELEAMESQLRLYDNQVSYSTVHLNINEVTKFTSTAPKPVSMGGRISEGLSDNFTAVVTALTNLLVFLITTSPFWLPALFIILVIRGIVLSRRSNKETAEPPVNEAGTDRKENPPT